jgi:hypothetical protein
VLSLRPVNLKDLESWSTAKQIDSALVAGERRACAGRECPAGARALWGLQGAER